MCSTELPAAEPQRSQTGRESAMESCWISASSVVAMKRWRRTASSAFKCKPNIAAPAANSVPSRTPSLLRSKRSKAAENATFSCFTFRCERWSTLSNSSRFLTKSARPTPVLGDAPPFRKESRRFESSPTRPMPNSCSTATMTLCMSSKLKCPLPSTSIREKMSSIDSTSSVGGCECGEHDSAEPTERPRANCSGKAGCG
mmetsp:Transcript_39826/g.127616  ORF Transcript_39826/g.127616 Transcript_39826/m.127616 type:complete len:200 (-) Transcript_39826:813-1412(-)